MVEQWQEVVDTAPDVSRVLEYLSDRKHDANCLKPALESAARAVFEAELEAGQMPRRDDLRKKLEAIEAAAKTISKLVLHPAILATVPHLCQVFGPSVGFDVPDVLAAMNRLLRVIYQEKRRILHGRGRQTSARSFGRISSRTLCARVIVEAWRRVRGRFPGANNLRAQQACAALWVAAGQKSSDRAQSGDVVEGAAWQRHLRDARKLDKQSADGASKRPTDPASVLAAIAIQRAADIFRDSCTSFPESS